MLVAYTNRSLYLTNKYIKHNVKINTQNEETRRTQALRVLVSGCHPAKVYNI
jgi:hypothetical protein